jgi:hypothetical protein
MPLGVTIRGLFCFAIKFLSLSVGKFLNINSRFQKSGENVHRHGLAVSVVIFSEGDERFSCGISHAKSFHSYGATNKTSLGIV